ncbi:MAG TPA: hypothetical protein VFA75_19510 [Nevskia sp.]|nr:hypothetical protein [Nevskia sp.]
MAQEQAVQAAEAVWSRRLDGWLLALCVGLLAVVAAMLAMNLVFQYHNYHLAVGDTASLSPLDRAVMAVEVSRALDFAVVKTSATFMGYLLVFLGTAFVLRAAQAAYSLQTEGGEGLPKLTLTSTSPGLVLATLGVLCVGLALYSKTKIELTASQKGPPAAAQEANTAAKQDAAVQKAMQETLAALTAQSVGAEGPSRPAGKAGGAAKSRTDEAIGTFPLTGHRGLDAEERARLDRVAEKLVGDPTQTLDIRPKPGNGAGDTLYQVALVVRLGDLIKQYLMQKGVPQEQLRVYSWGEMQPVLPDAGPGSVELELGKHK